MSQKYVYSFAAGNVEGNRDMRDILGGKGANLAEMAGIGLPVPPGFTISTEACNAFLQAGNRIPEEVEEEIRGHLKKLEEATGQNFGDESNPLLVSVRSGAKFSMPGMMDTVLNLGLNDRTVEGLARKSGNSRFALDCYRRLFQMFGDVVLEVGKKNFEELLRKKKKENNIANDSDLSEDHLRELISDLIEYCRTTAISVGEESGLELAENLLTGVPGYERQLKSYEEKHSARSVVSMLTDALVDGVPTMAVGT